jgi:hypothetical protein
MGYRVAVTEYTLEEKQRALEELAVHLLRAKDGKVRGLRRNGEIISLAKELEHAEKETFSPDGPDSDDEDSGIH